MLEADDRTLLRESLRPPFGYRLDEALGTTFTLDLLALLTTPLAFTLFDAEDSGDGRTSDPVALLRAVREYGERITILCQGGQISVPPHDQLLYAELEDSVYQVVSNRSLFHPKVWVLRFVGDGGSVRYRLLCLSRNLTFDRSWDTVLRLDGELERRPVAESRPFSEFVSALAELRIEPKLPRARANRIKALARELARVKFELPDRIEEIRFWPLGISGHREWPIGGDIRRLLIVSPFVGEDCLRRLTAEGSGHVVVSRSESLDRIADRVLLQGLDVRVMDDAAALEPAAEADGASADSDGTEFPEELCGLHAKVYAADRGRKASIWVGSANATGAGFESNVELLVELKGSVWTCGVDAVLDGSRNDADSFGALLKAYPVDEVPPDRDPDLEALEAELQRTQVELASKGFALRVEPEPDAEDAYAAELLAGAADQPALPEGVQLFAWPVTRNPGEARVAVAPSSDRVVARFRALNATSITPFLAFELQGERGDAQHQERFVLRVRLRGAPAGRREDVLRAVLSDRERILRYLLMILAETDGGSTLGPDVLALLARGHSRDQQANGQADLPLLEGLLRALENDDEKLVQIAKLVADLDNANGSTDALPEGFREIWEPIWAARRRVRR